MSEQYVYQQDKSIKYHKQIVIYRGYKSLLPPVNPVWVVRSMSQRWRKVSGYP